jgi:hypothetical protein
MRTTIDLPDDLMRRAKATAAIRGMKLKELFEEILRKALAPVPSQPTLGQKRPLPATVVLPGGPIKAMSNAEIDEMFVREELEKYGLD